MAALREITFVTGNADKLRELRTILEGVVNVVNKKIDLPELQGEVEDIIREKCKLAAAEVHFFTFSLRVWFKLLISYMHCFDV
tara:strand:- start:439 stop:687 length:249 start_codon:yes stop_codon:yes gene_type:complete